MKKATLQQRVSANCYVCWGALGCMVSRPYRERRFPGRWKHPTCPWGIALMYRYNTHLLMHRNRVHS